MPADCTEVAEASSSTRDRSGLRRRRTQALLWSMTGSSQLRGRRIRTQRIVLLHFLVLRFSFSVHYQDLESGINVFFWMQIIMVVVVDKFQRTSLYRAERNLDTFGILIFFYFKKLKIKMRLFQLVTRILIQPYNY